MAVFRVLEPLFLVTFSWSRFAHRASGVFLAFRDSALFRACVTTMATPRGFRSSASVVFRLVQCFLSCASSDTCNSVTQVLVSQAMLCQRMVTVTACSMRMRLAARGLQMFAHCVGLRDHGSRGAAARQCRREAETSVRENPGTRCPRGQQQRCCTCCRCSWIGRTAASWTSIPG